MKRFILCLAAVLPVILYSQKTDPDHLADGGYGYIIEQSPLCSVWWAEGAYKVMRDAPVPTRSDTGISIWSAKNESESFIIVVKPGSRMENFRIRPATLSDAKGNILPPESMTIRKTGYVKVTRPTDSYGFTGWWPDPLPLYDKPETLIPGENQPFWITVRIPENAVAGEYTGSLLLSSGNWSLKVPLRLNVWNFALPRTPAMRSGFGFSMGNVARYHNISTPEDMAKQFRYCMESFRDYRISPYDPFLFAPVKESVTGVPWEGGFFDSKEKYDGTYSYRVTDKSLTSNDGASTRELVPVIPGKEYSLGWFSRSNSDEHAYLAGVECYNAEQKLLVFENRLDIFSSSPGWKAEKLSLGKLGDEIRYVKILLFPAGRTLSGADTGTVWFDNLTLINSESGENEFPAGNFEVNPDNIDIKLDYSAFNEAGKIYFDEYGFTGYRLSLKGLGQGTYYSREKGYFEGFEQGTAEYNKLMARYLSQMQENLGKNGWLGKEYVYWFDEPGENDYEFVRETNALIKKYAPGITTFLTEHIAGHDITDVTDISCTIWHKLDHDKISRVNARGKQYWSYLCCWPKSPWVSEFIDHDAINMRMWLWGSWKHNLKGILIWETTYWNSDAASPAGYVQNPWDEAMSFVTGYGWPLGKQTYWGNGDGRLFYPINRDPQNDRQTYIGKLVPSIRLEMLRDGVEDYDYFVILRHAIDNTPASRKKLAAEAARFLAIPEEIYSNEQTYTKNPQLLLEYRKKIARYIVELSGKQK